MEEGPEPQELLEQAEHHRHEAEHSEGDAAKKKFVMKAAITASVLAVLAALASLLSGHAANEAILKQAEASDKWSYYQAKSTKSHIFEGNKFVVMALAAEDGRSASPAVAKALQGFDDKIKLYDKEKDEIQKEAQATETASAMAFHKHLQFSLAVACFQIGIVLASVAILVSSAPLLYGSIGAGGLGILLVVYGLVV